MRGAPWLGFHLHAPEPWDVLLLEWLAPAMEAERHAGRLRRFFFLRYDEGGRHIRLRLLARGITGSEMQARLEAHLRAWPAAGEWRLQAHRYDRSELYFGPTRESVYAELLNEATSTAALTLLAAPGTEDRIRRWLGTAVLLDVLLVGSTGGGEARAAALVEACRFARRGAAAVGRPLPEGSPSAPSPEALTALARAREQMGTAFASAPAVLRAASLLARARRYCSGGAAVATHALHLLCNKIGLSFHEEHNLFSALSLVGDPVERSAAALDGASEREPATLVGHARLADAELSESEIRGRFRRICYRRPIADDETGRMGDARP